jgi:hypothetical protein
MGTNYFIGNRRRNARSRQRIRSPSEGIVALPSRRLSGGRLARRAEGEDALGTAGKMPALLGQFFYGEGEPFSPAFAQPLACVN